MQRKQFTDAQIVAILQQAEKGGQTIAEVCRQHNIAENTFYRWRNRFGGASANEAARIRELEKENARLKRLLADRALEVDVARELLQKNSGGRRPRRGASKRRSLRPGARTDPAPGVLAGRAGALLGSLRSASAWRRGPGGAARPDWEPYPRFGVRRAHALLRTRGQAANRKRVHRLWREAGLQVPQRAKKRRIKAGRRVPCQAERPNHVWSCDFQEDALLSGRKVRILNILDEFTREWLSVSVGTSLTSRAVLAALRPLFASRGVPGFVRSDNGPEFIAAEVKEWLDEHGSAPYYIDPGCPWQNGFTESFHGKLRDELLNREVFDSVKEAQARLEAQQRWYNEERPHSSLKYLSPVAFRTQWQREQGQEAGKLPD